MDIEKLMSAQQVAARLGITKTAVHRLAARGTLPALWVGGQRVFRREAIELYLRNEELQKRRRSHRLWVGGVPEGEAMTVNEAIVDAVRKKREGL